MNLPTTVPATPPIEEALATLAALATRFDTDRPLACLLHKCKDDLDQMGQARRWNSYAAMVTARSARAATKRRHTRSRGRNA